MRLFVAIGLSQEVRSALLAAIDVLRRQGRGNFTRPENLHLTLAFIGETDRAQEAEAAILGVEAPAFSLMVEGIGRFQDLYWAGTAPCPPLTTLQRQVEGALRSWEFPLERRPFRPHLTLCRSYRPGPGFDPAAVKRALGAPACPIDRIRLMASSRVDGRLTYTEVAHKRLQPLAP